jgi:hypothetical protein
VMRGQREQHRIHTGANVQGHDGDASGLQPNAEDTFAHSSRIS